MFFSGYVWLSQGIFVVYPYRNHGWTPFPSYISNGSTGAAASPRTSDESGPTRHGRVRHGHRATSGGQYPAAAAGSSAAPRRHFLGRMGHGVIFRPRNGGEECGYQKNHMMTLAFFGGSFWVGRWVSTIPMRSFSGSMLIYQRANGCKWWSP